MSSDHDILLSAFDSREWREAADGFFSATGLSMCVMDFEACDLLYLGNRCSYCQLALGNTTPAPLACFDGCPDSTQGVVRQTCRAGFVTYLSPVMMADRAVAWVVFGGFISATRERNRLYERLLSQGVREDAARIAVRSMPVVTRREIESFVRMMTSMAETVVSRAHERAVTSDRLQEVSVLAGASHDLLDGGWPDPEAPGRALGHLMRFVDADGGAIWVVRQGGVLQALVGRGLDAPGAGAHIRVEDDEVISRAIATNHAVLVPGDTDRRGTRPTLLVAPLMRSDQATGAIRLIMRPGAPPPTASDVRLVERYARTTASIVDATEAWNVSARTVSELVRLDEFSAMLGRTSDFDQIADYVSRIIEASCEFDVAGLVVSGWGRDRADVIVRGDATSAEITMLLEDSAGRDLAADPFERVRYHTRHGVILEADEQREGWSTLSVKMSSADHVTGYLFVASASGLRYGTHDHTMLERIAGHAAPAFERAALFGRIRDDYAKTIAALSATLDASERAPQGHSSRVMDY
ncbi:MAG: PocR ligand-binding domain-containing protein, partial [Actinomycetota bacterium]|nr:PocR ligand-binding domain-containing protein [Actinomycetota bacterium]